MLPTVHYNMGGIPTNIHREVLAATGTDQDKVVLSLMAPAKACASRGTARTGSAPTLLDPWCSACAAAHRAAETIKPGATQAPLPSKAGEASPTYAAAAGREGSTYAELRLVHAAHHAGPRRGVPHLRTAEGRCGEDELAAAATTATPRPPNAPRSGTATMRRWSDNRRATP